jgi:hypothetical protein
VLAASVWPCDSAVRIRLASSAKAAQAVHRLLLRVFVAILVIDVYILY